MKIKIVAEIPTDPSPEIGKTYEVIRENKREKGGNVYFVEVKGKEIGVLARKMEIIER